MNDDFDFDPAVLRSYLAEGPEQAPPGTVDPVMAQVRREPRRRLVPAGLLVQLRQARERLALPAAAARLAWAAVLLALLVLTLLVAALVGRRQPPLQPAMNGLVAVAVAGDVWLVDPGSGAATALTTTADIDETVVAWSPDGRSLAVAVHERSPTNSRIDVIDLANGSRQTLAGSYDAIAGGPIWSPDGELVLFSARLGERGLVLGAALDGAILELASATGAAGLSVSPDGLWLAFASEGVAGPELRIVPLSGDAAARSVALAAAGTAVLGGPVWTSDGLGIHVAMAGNDPGSLVLARVGAHDGTVATVDGPWGDGTAAPILGTAPTGTVVSTGQGVWLLGPAGPIDVQPVEGKLPVAIAVSPDGRRLAGLRAIQCAADTCPVGVATLPLAPAEAAAGSEPQDLRIGARVASDASLTGTVSWQPLPYPHDELEIEFDETCVTLSDGQSTQVGSITRYEDVVLSCTDRATDPRLSGTRTTHVTIDMEPDESATLRGTSLLENADGRWAGSFSGTVTAGYTWHEVSAVAQGSGAFAGLTYRFHVTGAGTVFTGTGSFGPSD
jgi:hypothetical protein